MKLKKLFFRAILVVLVVSVSLMMLNLGSMKLHSGAIWGTWDWVDNPFGGVVWFCNPALPPSNCVEIYQPPG